MTNNMRIENWCGHDIRFIEQENGEWWAILKDICDALDLRTTKVAERLDSETMRRIRVEIEIGIPSEYSTKDKVLSKDIIFNRTTKKQWMIAVNEIGIYEALFASRRLEARKFRTWSARVMQKLRKTVGLDGYQVMQMTDPDIQAQIDHILDTIYWDEEKKCLMRFVTVQGGDVEQVPFEE